MPLTEDQEQLLTQGADCNLHYHSTDRDISHDQVLQFQGSESVKEVSASRAVTYADDFLFVDSSAGAITLDLPIARGGKTYTVVRIAGSSSVTLQPTGLDKINGASSYVITTSFAPMRLKALKGTGWIQV